MDSTPSPIETLRQLKEMLDAGTLTPTEFETLKQKLVFGSVTNPSAEAAPLPDSTLSPPMELSGQAIFGADVPESSSAKATVSPSGEERTVAAPDDYLPGPAEPAPRNYLNLVLSIGGLIALLGIVLYLNLHPRESEHIGSNSQTAADSVKTIEVGPQAEQITLPPPAPETVRIAPAHPAPAIVRPAPITAIDSVAPATDSVR